MTKGGHFDLRRTCFEEEKTIPLVVHFTTKNLPPLASNQKNNFFIVLVVERAGMFSALL